MKTSSPCECAAENKKMKQLLADMLPDLQSRVDGLRQSWPGKDVLTALYRNERFLNDAKDFSEKG